MAQGVADRYQSTLNRLQEQLAARLPAEQAEAIGRFAALLYRSVSAREIEGIPVDQLYGSILESWYFLQQRQPGQTKVKVFNPDNEANGWASNHTIILILLDDMPFQIDSLRMEVNRRGLTLHNIQNAILTVERENGELLSLSNFDQQSPDNESYVYLEIDRYAKPAEQRELKQSLIEVLGDVQAVTEDFESMMAQSNSLLERLDQASLPSELLREQQAFLRWTMDNHFTFLGYEQFKLVKHKSGPVMRSQPSSRLGLCRMPWAETEARLLSDVSVRPGQAVALEELIGFAKSSTPVRVHRPVYANYILLREFDEQGVVCVEHRFLGLYTSPVYTESPRNIPVVRTKVEQVLERAELYPGSHDWKELRQILETYPRDDLFQIDVDALFESVLDILHIHERRQIRLFVRRAAYGRYYSCLVFVPRDLYNTDLRQRVQKILCEAFECEQVEFNTLLSESLLARTQFILHMREQDTGAEVDFKSLEQRVIQAARSWSEELLQALADTYGDAQGAVIHGRCKQAFPASYRDDFSPRAAVADIDRILQLSPEQPLGMSFYRPLGGQDERFNFKLYHYGKPIPLSEVIPVMEHLGLIVQDEHPYAIQLDDGKVWLHDFGLTHSAGTPIEIEAVRDIFLDAFDRIWAGDCASDSFNRLVLGASMDWREVSVLRAYAAYMKQIGLTLSQHAIAGSLMAYPQISRLLIEIFNQRFNPAQLQGLEPHQIVADRVHLLESFSSALDQVPGLTEDRILRLYNDLISATVRTNFFQLDADAKPKTTLVLKLKPRALPEVPQPAPMFELFVHSARFEGVHLRAGKIARGGLRWSDRSEDYRTEVLGLVKAQQVKNAVIVPVGAKGGFICHRLHDGMTPQQRFEEGRSCYQGFIRGLLDVTDNAAGGIVEPPDRVRCYDEPDPYLVVAADKGTATFSDTANEIAQQYDFWLGDAFASGGSQGYDHKAMGITARGGWVAVQRHFRELSINMKEPFSVVGIGAMAGDVFGNGMLCSDQIQLVAAFSQFYIFVDPNPDPEASYAERKRLFEAVADWDQYDRTLISEGGGVFHRSAKMINITPAMKRRFGLEVDRLSANEFLCALLAAPVDLLWNGAIGTYVKSSAERHADVGDKANDNVRIDASQLRARVVGEGGNLGMTAASRIEYSLQGGACNGDFIDNSAGVNCSDYEVNIKIFLDAQVRAGEMTAKQRNQLLVKMTDPVAERVLRDNFQQVEAITMAQAQAHERLGEYRRYIQALEREGLLDRELESIPDEEELDRRRQLGQGLTRPELAVLISITKGWLKQQLLDSELPDDPYVQKVMLDAFPEQMVKRFAEQLQQHPLRRELISTRIANALVNHMGCSFVHRMRSTTAASVEEIVRAYILARDIYDLNGLWKQIDALEALEVRREVQLRMLLELQRMIRRAARWLLRNRHPLLLDQGELEQLQPLLHQLAENMGDWLLGSPAQAWKDRFYFYTQAGVPEALARQIAGTTMLYAALGMNEISDERVGLQQVAAVYCLLGERLDLFWLSRTIDSLSVINHWQASARETLRDDLELQTRRLGVALIPYLQEHSNADAGFEAWVGQHELMVTQWLSMLAELKNSDRQDYAIYTVAIKRLSEIAAA
ncbi:NAD-glutamate dehydrogenase [Motiliproteus sp.]|uniref:NAD-glutamate dehydrogenase n=1 Tax=Motiliproteus sp. TaxID=1898955 RepID=UPI003BA850C0